MPEHAPTIWYVHPYAGGPDVGRYGRPYELGKVWQSLGARVVVITASFHHLLDAPGSRIGLHDIGGVPYEFLRTPPSYRGNGARRLANMATFTAMLAAKAGALARRHGKPHMVIGSSPHPYLFLATHRLARRWGARSVFEVRDLWPLSLVELAGLPEFHPLVRATAWLERYAYARADAVVSLLPKTLEHMSERGLDPARWYYVPNGADLAATTCLPGREMTPASLQAARWKAQGRFVVAYTGALGQPNYLEPLVDAMALLRQQGENRIVALIVGRGERAEALARRIQALGLQDRIALHGQIPKRAIPTLLQHVDIGYISLRPEPLFRFGISPNKLLDYMAARLPVLFAVSAGNNPVEEAGCGRSAVPGDPVSIAEELAAFSKMPHNELVEMGNRGHAYVRREHDYATLANRYLNILRQPGQAFPPALPSHTQAQ